VVDRGGTTQRLAHALAGVTLVMAVSGCLYPSPSLTTSQAAAQPSVTRPESASPTPAAPSWTATGAMMEARPGHTATLLLNGKVLVAGGYDPSFGDTVAMVATAELYDPATGSWTATGPMLEGRYAHTATLLADGRVLVAGGFNAGLLASAELYDPATGTWSATGSMLEPRVYYTATLLPDGNVLVAGTFYGSSDGPYSLASAELYNPVRGSWIATGSMAHARGLQTATLLRNGRVLVAGGSGDGQTNGELYDPNAKSWSNAGLMVEGRDGHTATLLRDGTVLLVGAGSNLSEVYDPVDGSWTATRAPTNVGRDHTATLLPNGKVLVAGGYDPSGDGLAAAQLYDPSSRSWIPTVRMLEARTYHTATLLPNGKVLVAGGSTTIDANSLSQLLATAELYEP
jgi:WD40 repeat protein